MTQPRDTPVDTPRLGDVGDIIERPQLGLDPAVAGKKAFAQARSVETLEALYLAWTELSTSWSTAKKRWADEEKRLVTQGELLLGAMRAASSAAPSGDQTLANVNVMALDAEKKLAEVRAQFAAQIAQANVTFARELERMRTELIDHVRRRALVSRPIFKLAVRLVGSERRILHLSRLSDDDAIVALFSLTGRVPSRYGYLADDSLDDVGVSSAPLYADEGIVDVRPTDLGAVLSQRPQLWPVKGLLPMQLGARWLRWVARGAVLEAEFEEHSGWRNVLTKEEAEQLTGVLLTHKLAGRIELELVRE
jgi:hypothetical protein